MSESERPTHSKIGASSYYRWEKCPGSVKLSQGIVSPESEHARKGTMAHEAAALLVEGKPFSFKDFPELDNDDWHAVEQYANYVKYLATPGMVILVEHKFDLSQIHPGLYGTSDAIVYSPEHRKLVVIDYKHGAGIPVEVEENKQLMYYGLGALLATKLSAVSIDLVIVQPRCFHKDGPIRKWSTTPARMFEFAADLARDAAKTETPRAPLNPGEWCRFCPAKPNRCPAIREKSLALAQQTFSPMADYDPAKLAHTLQMLDTVESWVKGVREFAYREATSGRVPPGFKLVEKRAHRKWRDPSHKPDALARDLGLNEPDVVEIKLKTPAAIERLIPKNLKDRVAEVLEKATVKESSGLTLVPVDDSRSEVKNDPKRVFDAIE